MRWLLFTSVLSGCATAGPSDQVGGRPDSGVRIDSSGQQVDAYVNLIDAPPGQQTKTLSQTTSPVLTPGTSLACGSSTGTAANNYYRVFDLATFGITTEFHVTQVSFQVEDCDTFPSGACAQVAVRVGTYSGTPGATLTTAAMTVLASNATVSIPEIVEDPGPPAATTGGTVNVPLNATIAVGQKLLVEVDTPAVSFSSFYMGANAGGETGHGYVMASTCGINVPTDISTVGAAPPPPVHLLLTVTGTY